MKLLSHVQLFATPWTVADQALLSMGFSRQEYWSRFPFPSPGDLPDPGIKPTSPSLADGFFTTEPPVKVILSLIAVNLIKINFAVAIGSSGGLFKCQQLTLRAMISAISPVSN